MAHHTLTPSPELCIPPSSILHFDLASLCPQVLDPTRQFHVQSSQQLYTVATLQPFPSISYQPEPHSFTLTFTCWSYISLTPSSIKSHTSSSLRSSRLILCKSEVQCIEWTCRVWCYCTHTSVVHIHVHMYYITTCRFEVNRIHVCKTRPQPLRETCEWWSQFLIIHMYNAKSLRG